MRILTLHDVDLNDLIAARDVIDKSRANFGALFAIKEVIELRSKCAAPAVLGTPDMARRLRVPATWLNREAEAGQAAALQRPLSQPNPPGNKAVRPGLVAFFPIPFLQPKGLHG